MEYFIGFVVGVIIGAGLAVLIGYLRGRWAESRMSQTFAALAGEALDANSRRLAETAAATLDTKKQLIDQTLKNITIGATVAGVALTGTLFKLTAETAKAAAKAEQYAKALGLTPEGLQEWEFALERTGGSINAFKNGTGHCF